MTREVGDGEREGEDLLSGLRIDHLGHELGEGSGGEELVLIAGALELGEKEPAELLDELGVAQDAGVLAHDVLQGLHYVAYVI